MITIYHNSQCSKSRAACALIKDKLAGDEPVTIIEYLKTPPALDELRLLRQLLRVPVRDMIRNTEKAYYSLQLEDTSLSEERLFEAIVTHPILLQRPIIVRGQQAIIGRPPENIERFFSQFEL